MSKTKFFPRYHKIQYAYAYKKDKFINPNRIRTKPHKTLEKKGSKNDVEISSSKQIKP